MPVSDELAADAGFSGLFTRHKPGYAVSTKQNELEQNWRQQAMRRYDAATQIAEKVLEQLHKLNDSGVAR